MARKGNVAEPTVHREALRPADDAAGLSLDDLSAAFAQMLSTGDDPYVSPGGPEIEVIDDDSARAHAVETDAVPADSNCEVSPQTILEAMLFVSSPDNSPLTSQQAASLMRGVRPAEIDGYVIELNERYTQAGCPYEIVSHAAGYRLALRAEFTRVGERFHGKARQAKLSQAAVEVLALVAYRQPLTLEEINTLRGGNAASLVTQLVRRELLTLDRTDGKPRYSTTERFLKTFGLETLEDLPQSEE